MEKPILSGIFSLKPVIRTVISILTAKWKISYQSGINAASFISSERENTLSGIFFENFVAEELTAKGNKLFYWKGKAAAELEFIVESDNKLYPIDVKKGRGTLNSLEKFSDHNRFECAIKVSKNNYGFNEEQRLLTISFYFFSFVARDLSEGKMEKNSCLTSSFKV